MINLAGLRDGETVCDQFCGTGTTLLEAESTRMPRIGLDFDEKMCSMTRESLKANGYKSQVLQVELGVISEMADKFDGIVTDLPYGISSKTTESPQQIIKKFLATIPKRKRVWLLCTRKS